MRGVIATNYEVPQAPKTDSDTLHACRHIIRVLRAEVPVAMSAEAGLAIALDRGWFVPVEGHPGWVALTDAGWEVAREACPGGEDAWASLELGTELWP